ncbi:MAG: SCO family protein [Myxococcota bacterium]|nr:SCO family protein [Myxococcota bacterium]
MGSSSWKWLVVALVVAGCSKGKSDGPQAPVDQGPPQGPPVEAVLTNAPQVPPATGPTLPPGSLYQWEGSLKDQRGNTVAWSVGQGRTVLISMFYSTCPYACPMLISSIKHLEKKLSPQAREQVVVVLVSMDPVRDTPEANLRMAQAHGVDPSRWYLLQPDPRDVPEIAALLGMTYRQNADGSFGHSMQVTALAPDGAVIAKRGTPNDEPAEILAALERSAGSSR